MRRRLKTTNYYSFVDWGRARELDKFLVLLLPKKPESKWDQEMMAELVNESLDSFNVARNFLKDAIIRVHPKLKLQSFAEYRDLLFFLYTHFNPRNVDRIDEIMARYRVSIVRLELTVAQSTICKIMSCGGLGFGHGQVSGARV